MKKLVNILQGIHTINTTVVPDLNINGIQIDSRKVKEGDLFIAYKGVHTDGHRYIDAAIKNGAAAVVMDDPEFSGKEGVFILVEDARKASSLIAANYYDHPSRKLKVTGVTGTNGKTSVASLLYRLFDRLDKKSALISTIEIIIGDKTIDSSLTTPDPVSLQYWFAEMVKQEVAYVFMEVSSHALVQGRTDQVDFDLAVFTNISRDHLDYHGTFAEYIKAKKQLFDTLDKEADALVNIDDVNGRIMLQNCKAIHHTYAVRKPADFKAKILSNGLEGLHLQINNTEVYLKLIGRFNAYNATAVFGAANLLGVESHDILINLSGLNSAEGRMDVVQTDKVGYKAVVDYAHTPDALEKVLKTLQDVKEKNKKVICVFGCGGDRDKGKRPQMGNVAEANSDIVIVTSDNPRSEAPEDIIKDIMQGIEAGSQKTVLKNSDRQAAISTACALAKDGDIILVAGKGHEKYQEIGGQRIPFDDKKILNALMH